MENFPPRTADKMARVIFCSEWRACNSITDCIVGPFHDLIKGNLEARDNTADSNGPSEV